MHWTRLSETQRSILAKNWLTRNADKLRPISVVGFKRLCTKNTSRALIERPYSCAPQAVGAVYDVYDRPGFFVQSPSGDAGIITFGRRDHAPAPIFRDE